MPGAGVALHSLGSPLGLNRWRWLSCGCRHRGGLAEPTASPLLLCAADSLPQTLLSLLLLLPLLLSNDTVVQSVIMYGGASRSCAAQLLPTALLPPRLGDIVHSSIVGRSAGCLSWSL